VARARALVIACVVVAQAACSRTDEPRLVVELEGVHRFRLGDDPAYATSTLDDSTWESVDVPSTWRAWRTGGAVTAWYRIHFDFPSDAPRDHLAVDLGVVGWSDETYLNGRRVGATGARDGLPIPVYLPRVYALPEAALRPGPNVLAVRVRGLPLARNGLLAARIGIGDELELVRARDHALSRMQIAQGALLGFLGFAWLLMAFFPKRGRTGRATILLWASITLQLVHLWLLSLVGRDTGWRLDGHAQAVAALMSVTGCLNWAYVSVLVRGHVRPLLKGLIAAELGTALLLMFGVELLGAAVVIAVGIGLGAGACLLPMLVVAARARTPGAIPVLVGAATVGISVVTSLAAGDPFVRGIPIIYFGFASFIVCGMLALTQHVRQTSREAQRAAAYALDAHTRERTRLARDLHDGLGQMLALLKLQLQRRGGGDESVAQVDVTIEEMRRISRDLRPTPLEDRGFGEAVREYALALGRRTDIAIVVDGDLEGPLPEGVGDELYRVVQESLTNCLKHSGARRITVTMADAGDRRVLTVCDDGCGLPAGPTAGLGLTTIRERSELLGGTCIIGAAPGGGTRIEVSVPR